jgi:YbgC/YbaW family acyl-CoA thioester hydrolase
MKLEITMFEIQVQSTHLDRFGHVNNSVYMEYFEWARWDWSLKNGFDFMEMIKKGVGPVLVNIEISFKKELLFRDKLFIETKFSKKSEKSFTLKQVMRNIENETVSIAFPTIVIVDKKKKKAVSVPHEILKKIDENLI